MEGSEAICNSLDAINEECVGKYDIMLADAESVTKTVLNVGYSRLLLSHVFVVHSTGLTSLLSPMMRTGLPFGFI